MTFLKTYWQDITIIVFLGIVFYLGWHCRASADLLKQQQIELKAQKKAQAVDTEWNTKVQTLSKHGIELNHKLENAVAKPIYISCNLTPDVVRLLDSYGTASRFK